MGDTESPLLHASKRVDDPVLRAVNKHERFYYPFGFIWPGYVIAKAVVSRGDTGGSLRKGLNWGTLIMQLVVSVAITFIFGYIFSVIYGASKAVFDSFITSDSHVGALAPVVYGLLRAAGLYFLLKFTLRLTGGHLMLWDTLVFAMHGWINREPQKPFKWMQLIESLVVGMIYIVVLLLASYLGGLTTDYFVRGSPLNGAPVPENSLVGREGPIIFFNFGATMIYIFARMYMSNPFVVPKIKTIVVAFFVASALGGYVGTTGTVDLWAPLGMAFVADRYPFFWAMFLGQLIGCISAVLLFHVVATYSAIENRLISVSKNPKRQ